MRLQSPCTVQSFRNGGRSASGGAACVRASSKPYTGHEKLLRVGFGLCDGRVVVRLLVVRGDDSLPPPRKSSRPVAAPPSASAAARTRARRLTTRSSRRGCER